MTSKMSEEHLIERIKLFIRYTPYCQTWCLVSRSLERRNKGVIVQLVNDTYWRSSLDKNQTDQPSHAEKYVLKDLEGILQNGGGWSGKVSILINNSPCSKNTVDYSSCLSALKLFAQKYPDIEVNIKYSNDYY
eukprot:TCONS_00062361-protein